MSTSLFSKTPSVTVLDNRGRIVRNIAYHRHPDATDVTDERITRHQYDARSFLIRSADPRLHETGLANFSYLTDLTGSMLRTQGADIGITVTLNDAAGRPFITVSNISTTDASMQGRSQVVTRTWQYEDATLPGRPLSITEQVSGEGACITERLVYANHTDAEKALNLAGQLVSHYDTAGLKQTDSIALTGMPLSVTRRLLKDADSPEVVANWQGTDVSAWNDLLNSEAYTTLTTADAAGAELTTVDAKGNLQRAVYDVAGLLSASWMTLKDGTEQVIVASLMYSPVGQKLREEHGNGVVTTYTYEPETQRLTGIKTERPTGHTSGAKVLQDLRYEYDPVGNVLKVSNHAEETRFWRNQKVVPENTYAYDSLYQLVSATGREMANVGQQGCSLPSATVTLSTDNSAYTNYTRTYTYDCAGNLTQMRHSPATSSGYTTKITVSDKSNRGVLSTLTEVPAEVDALFRAGGQQQLLLPGQNLVWTPRNELLKVTLVVRDGDMDDRESYRYDYGYQRLLKVSLQKTGNSVQTQRALYLPRLELRTTTSSSTETGNLQVITMGEAGRAQVRMLHWESGRPTDITGDQVRYSYDNLTGSSSLELDAEGNIISIEEYYPYGGTALWTARSAVEANYKTTRYSGKERDATGLYYYGYRYYQPWVGRWLSADPANTVDGLNLFRMARNNPVSLFDYDGLAPVEPNIHETKEYLDAVMINFEEKIRPSVMARKEKDKEAALNRLSSVENIKGQELGELLEKISSLISLAPLSFNHWKIILGDKLRNYWELQDVSGGLNEYQKARNTLEMSIYNVGCSNYEQRNTINGLDFFPSKTSSPARMNYGAVSFEGALGGATKYGKGAMLLNESVKEYVTYTPYDSYMLFKEIGEREFTKHIAINENVYPLISTRFQSRLNEKILLGARGGGEGANVELSDVHDYFEWQSHQKIHFNRDIQSMALNGMDSGVGYITTWAADFSKKNRVRLD